jgi:hypothetical protein
MARLFNYPAVETQLKHLCESFITKNIKYLSPTGNSELSDILLNKFMSFMCLNNEVKTRKSFNCRILCQQPIDDVANGVLKLFFEQVESLLQSAYDTAKSIDKETPLDKISIKINGDCNDGSHFIEFCITISKETNNG